MYYNGVFDRGVSSDASSLATQTGYDCRAAGPVPDRLRQPLTRLPA